MKPEATDCTRRGELRDKVARGVAWNMAEKVGTALMQMAVSLIILRLLTREDLGLMAILTAVAAVALVIVDSGFSQTLIRKQAPEQHDFKSVFLFNVGVSAVLYFVFVAASPVAARFYDMPELVPLAPVFFLLLPVNALCTVQNVLFTRQFRFALLSKSDFCFVDGQRSRRYRDGFVRIRCVEHRCTTCFADGCAGRIALVDQ